MGVETLSWEQVKPIWDMKLWPGRDSDPVTSMKYLGGYDMALKDANPHFVGIVVGEHIIAVNSYVPTGVNEWRSRGLWVDSDFRKQGHAKTLLNYMLTHVRYVGGTMIWTMPRMGALVAYESVGFVRTTAWSEHDWGTNCYATVILADNSESG